jgi:2-polyprenyl-3-methyl-5-hydroxy-6-metoxy-1,4-benzoquinol methylase/ribosomal protein S27AE
MTSAEHRTEQDCPMCGSPSTEVLHHKEFGGKRWSLGRCRSCGLHFTDPRPSEAFLEECYAGDYHAELRTPGGTERAFGDKYQRYADWLGNHLARGRVLDVGCATGLLVRMLCDRGYRAEGIELNPRSAEWGRQHYGVTIHDQPLEHCPYGPGSLDAVVLTDVLEHTLHPRDFLASVGRLLIPGGLVLVTFPDIDSIESRYFRLIAKIARRPWFWRSCNVPLHIWEFTKETAQACFEGAGFRIIDFRRSQVTDLDDLGGIAKLIALPTTVLGWGPVKAKFGTQMEFLLKKTSNEAAGAGPASGGHG